MLPNQKVKDMTQTCHLSRTQDNASPWRLSRPRVQSVCRNMKISAAPSDVLISFNLITKRTTPRDLNRTAWVELPIAYKGDDCDDNGDCRWYLFDYWSLDLEITGSSSQSSQKCCFLKLPSGSSDGIFFVPVCFMMSLVGNKVEVSFLSTHSWLMGNQIMRN